MLGLNSEFVRRFIGDFRRSLRNRKGVGIDEKDLFIDKHSPRRDSCPRELQQVDRHNDDNLVGNCDLDDNLVDNCDLNSLYTSSTLWDVDGGPKHIWRHV